MVKKLIGLLLVLSAVSIMAFPFVPFRRVVQSAGTVVLNLQFDGTDGDTFTTDAGCCDPGTIYFQPPAVISNTHGETGTSFYPGAGYFGTPGFPQMELQTASTFSIKAWFYTTGSGGAGPGVEYVGSDGSWRFYIGYYGCYWQAGSPSWAYEQQIAGFDFNAYGKGFRLGPNHGWEVVFTHDAGGEHLYIDGLDLTSTLCYSGHSGDYTDRVWGVLPAFTGPTTFYAGKDSPGPVWYDNMIINNGGLIVPRSVPAGEGWYCITTEAYMDNEICVGTPTPMFTFPFFSFTNDWPSACTPTPFGPGTSSHDVSNAGPVFSPDLLPACP